MSGFGNNGNDGRFFIHLMKTAGALVAFQLRRRSDHSEVPCQGIDSRDMVDVAAYANARRWLGQLP